MTSKIGTYTFPREFERIQWSRRRKTKVISTGKGEYYQIRGSEDKIFTVDYTFLGSTAESDKNSAIAQMEKEYPIKFVYGNVDGYALPLGYEELNPPGEKRYPMRFTLNYLGDSSDWSRGRVYTYNQVSNDFGLDGTIIVPLPISATPVIETVDFNRTSADGNIPCVASPLLETISYSMMDESNLDNALVNASWSSGKFMLENGLVKIESRHTEASSPGRWNLYLYDGSAWLHYAILLFYGIASGGSEEEPLNPPSIDVLADYSNPLHKEVVFAYPSTATNGYNISGKMVMDAGKPFIQIELRSYGPTLNGVQYIITTNGANKTFQYYYNGVDGTLDATASAYGMKTTVGDTDTINYIYLTDVNPIDDTAIEVGFCRVDQADCDYIANDAGSNWSDMRFKFDNRTITGEAPAPKVWLFAQKQGTSGGGRTPSQIGDEIVMEIQGLEETITTVK